MLELLVVILYLGLLYLIFKMFGRYLFPALVGGIVLAIIGAIFTDGDTWRYFAYVGAGLGLLACLIIDFQNAWKTVLGASVGGGIGVGLAFLIGNSSMWSGVAFLACILAGGCIASAAAREDVTRETPKAERRKNTDDKEPYRDAKGNWHEDKPFNICRECCYYNSSRQLCDRHGSTAAVEGGLGSACEDFRR